MSVLARIGLVVMLVLDLVATQAEARPRRRPAYRPPPVERGWEASPRSWFAPAQPPGIITSTTPNASGNLGGPSTGGGSGGGG